MTITAKPQQVTINDRDYVMELGTIGFTRLGREDHGIFTFVLDMSFGSSGQGAGGYSLNDPALFGQAVQATLDFFGGNWENIAGRSVFALRNADDKYGPIRGLVLQDSSRALLFGDWEIVRG